VSHVQILRKNWIQLKRDIKITGTMFLDFLFQYDVLSSPEVEGIKITVSQEGESEGVHQILLNVLRSSYEQYKLFLDALLNGDNKSIFEYLTGFTFYLYYLLCSKNVG